MRRFLPPRAVPLAFGFLVSGIMTLLVSGISVYQVSGFSAGLYAEWLSAWGASWVVAFPAILLVAPFVRWLLSRIVIHPDGAAE